MLYFARMTRTAEMELLSAYENIELAEAVLAELATEAALGEELAYWIGMAFREALANAIKHGNGLDPDKRVHVAMAIEPSRSVRIAVEDEGVGFEVEKLADPTSPENILRQSGRGIFYMRHFMDEVRFSTVDSGGTRVELSKVLDRRGSE